MITHDRLLLAFSDEIYIAPPEHLPVGIVDATTRHVLTEVGLPEDLVGCVFFEDVGDSVTTLREFGQPTPTEVADYYVVAVSDYHVICVDGGSGRTYFVTETDTFLAASDLDVFLGLVCDIRAELSRLDGTESDQGLDRVEERLIVGFGDRDSIALAESEEQWRTLIRRCIGEVLL